MFRYYFYLVLGLIFGVAVSLMYLLGTPFAIRPIIPCAVGAVAVMYALTIFKVIFCKCMCDRPYVKTIVIAASIFLIFAMILMGFAAMPAGALKVFLTFVGATSFGVTLMTHIGFIFRMLR